MTTISTSGRMPPGARANATTSWAAALHLRAARGSWKRHPNGDSLNWRELAVELVNYIKEMEYTHIELLPVSEHPFSGSWGYQPVGMFSPTSRYGSADDFKYFVDQCHQAGIGVILDWVPAHFPSDAHGLARFDGTPLYEYEDPRRGWHPDWNSYIYDFGRDTVRQFLVASALFWLDKFHVDGLRVDAVASMLYLDYSRNAGEWVPNVDGGNHNYEAISLFEVDQRGGVRQVPPRHDHRRGVHRLRRGLPSHLPRRPGFWLQSGIWAGCTTPSATCRRSPSTAVTTTTT